MSEVSYSNVPPMMAAIKSGDIEAIRSLLHAGHSPNEPQCYHVMIGDWPRDDEASPLELAVLENRMDMVQLLIECGADLTHNPEELLCGSLRSQDLTLFSFLVDVGVRIPATQRDTSLTVDFETMTAHWAESGSCVYSKAGTRQTHLAAVERAGGNFAQADFHYNYPTHIFRKRTQNEQKNYCCIQRTTQEPSALRICSKKAFVVQIPLFCKRLGGSFTRMNSCHVWRPVGALMKKEH